MIKRKNPNGIEEGENRENTQNPHVEWSLQKGLFPKSVVSVVGLFSPLIVYTVTSIGDWVFGLLKLSLIDSVQDFCLPARSYPYVLTCKPASCPIVAWYLLQKKAKSTIGFEGEQSKTL